MNTVRKLYQSDETGMVRLYLPVEAPHRRVEVVVVWQEADGAEGSREAREKKQAELEALAGSLVDDPILRPEQPALEARLPIE